MRPARWRTRRGTGRWAGDEGQLEVAFPERASGWHGRTPIRKYLPRHPSSCSDSIIGVETDCPCSKIAAAWEQVGNSAAAEELIVGWAALPVSPSCPCRL